MPDETTIPLLTLYAEEGDRSITAVCGLCAESREFYRKVKLTELLAWGREHPCPPGEPAGAVCF